MACETVITNVPPVGQGKPASRHNGGGFVRFENCGSWDFWIHDVNANCNSIYNLAKINCIPLIDFLTTPLQVDVDANGHTIYNVGKILIGSSTDDGSGALLQVAGEINAQSYMLGGYEFASYATPGQIDLSNIYSINGVTGFLPAGPEGSIQYNDDGNFAGDSFFVYDETTHNVGIVPLGLGPQWRLDVGGDINIIDPTYTGYAYRINGIPFAVADPGGSHINLVNIGLINGAPPGSGGGGGALPGGQPGDIQFNVSGGLFGGSQNFFWDNTNNRLGIGTSSPAYPLDVVGNENITGCYYIANVPFACQSGSGIALQNIVTINGGPPGGAATLPGAPSGSIQYNQNNVFTGSTNLTWDWINNRMGIGTFAPGYPLDVVGNVNSRGCYLISGLTFACSDGAGGINLTNITNINGNPPGTGGGASVTVSDTPPASPSLGNLWFDSVGTQLYIWYTDPTSSQWVATINQCSGGSTGGETLPGSPLTSVQWNNNNTFAGSANMVWQDSVSTLAVNGIVQTPTLSAPVGSTLTVNSLNLTTFNVSGNNPLLITSTSATITYSAQIKANDNTFSPNLVFSNSANEQWTIEEDANLLGTGALRFSHYLSPGPTTERMCILPNGNVGIGTPTPAFTLDVNSAANAYVARFMNSGTFSGIIVDHTGTSGGESVVSFRSAGVEAAVIEYDSDEDNLIFWTGARDAANATLCCSTNSYVGIGTTSPINTLDVLVPDSPYTAPSTANAGIRFALSAVNTSMALMFGVSSAPYSWIQSVTPGVSYEPLLLNPNGGHVGIGTATPQQALDVNGYVHVTNWVGIGIVNPQAPLHVMPDTIRIESVPNSGAYAQLQLFGGNPVNSRVWRLASIGGGGNFVIEALDDAISIPSRPLSIDRTGHLGLSANPDPAMILNCGGNVNAAGYYLNGSPHLMLTPAEYADLQNLLARVSTLEARLG